MSLDRRLLGAISKHTAAGVEELRILQAQTSAERSGYTAAAMNGDDSRRGQYKVTISYARVAQLVAQLIRNQ